MPWLLFKLFNNMCFVFHAWAFDDVMTFGKKLKTQPLNISQYLQENTYAEVYI